MCLVNEVVCIIVNHANMLGKYFLKHDMSHPIRTITWNAHQGSSMILNVDGNSLGSSCISGFSRLIQNTDIA